jgi:hypothetical protein
MSKQKHAPIDWSKYPENKTSFGDTNGNYMDKSFDEILNEIQKLEIIYKINNILHALPLTECYRVYGYLSTLYSSEGGEQQ